MTEPRGPDDQTTIEDIQSPDWSAAAAPAAVSPPTPAVARRLPAAAGTRRRSGLRWLVALVGVAVVLGGEPRRRLAGRGPSGDLGRPRLHAGRHRPVRRGPPRPARRPAPEARRVPREGVPRLRRPVPARAEARRTSSTGSSARRPTASRRGPRTSSRGSADSSPSGWASRTRRPRRRDDLRPRTRTARRRPPRHAGAGMAGSATACSSRRSRIGRRPAPG